MPLGYILAIFAAAAVVAAAASEPPQADVLSFTLAYLFTVNAIGAVAFVPAAAAIIAAEILRLRSVFYFLAVGGGLGVVLNEVSIRGHFADATLDRADLVFPAAGFAAGFVYWLVVGRMSGRFNGARDLAPVGKNQPDGKGPEHAGK